LAVADRYVAAALRSRAEAAAITVETDSAGTIVKVLAFLVVQTTLLNDSLHLGIGRAVRERPFALTLADALFSSDRSELCWR
jgi:hypothetical protein